MSTNQTFSELIGKKKFFAEKSQLKKSHKTQQLEIKRNGSNQARFK